MPTRAKKEEDMNNDVTRTLKEGLNILTAEELLVLSYGARVSDGGIPNFMARVAIGVNGNSRALERYSWLQQLVELGSNHTRTYASNSQPDKKRCPRAKVWVAYYVKNGEVVGFCRLTNLRGNHVGTVEHLFVPDVDQRSLGLATALIAGLGDFAREQGMILLEAHSTTKMEEVFYDTVGKRGFDPFDAPCHRIKLS